MRVVWSLITACLIALPTDSALTAEFDDTVRLSRKYLVASDDALRVHLRARLAGYAGAGII